MTRELKPCPFCGGRADVYTREDEDLWTHNLVEYGRVECSDCNCETEDWPIHDRKPEIAWNTRAADPLLKELVGVILEYFKAMDSDTYDFIKTPFYRSAIEKALQKYREQHETNTK